MARERVMAERMRRAWRGQGVGGGSFGEVDCMRGLLNWSSVLPPHPNPLPRVQGRGDERSTSNIQRPTSNEEQLRRLYRSGVGGGAGEEDPLEGEQFGEEFDGEVLGAEGGVEE